ncbi:MAG: tRNA (adenosine(37)-N6)-threonylcarbamoyltransferase complex ATPase subunit type 1 TsaE [Candidatus Electryonea clarkiae]|nr:tRNA (adenosine(37)-N6)-threonylcarbamoyltransferase complex ATPase subunit type 1 TsaE [Candidatus Electryonea clarkiae]MDP8289152.1 tRNA (adenosine(37)-N6)-threonylcarbamoyltransferase complex ATPase subunit type 1 TsaE [Candidatus Electryonea clarkiae]
MSSISRRSKYNNTIESNSAHDTEEAGVNLSQMVKCGETVLLTGPLGTGKTTLVRGFMRGLEYLGRVRSPSFTVSNTYDSKPPVIHIDLYRLTDPDDLIVLDLEQQSENNITIIEWGNRFDKTETLADWRVKLEWDDQLSTKRLITIQTTKI